MRYDCCVLTVSNNDKFLTMTNPNKQILKIRKVRKSENWRPLSYPKRRKVSRHLVGPKVYRHLFGALVVRGLVQCMFLVHLIVRWLVQCMSALDAGWCTAKAQVRVRLTIIIAQLARSRRTVWSTV